MQPATAISNTHIRFVCRRGKAVLGLICLGLLLPGCGSVLYTYRASTASSKLEEARQAGAEKTTLYEYTLAQEHLKKAMSEASEADYGDAYALAQLADQYAAQALEKARLRMRAPAGTNAGSPAAFTPAEGRKPDAQAAPNHDAAGATAVPSPTTATSPASTEHEVHK